MPEDNRNFYRLPISVPAARAHKLLHDGTVLELSDPLILDLSIGGLKLHVREPVSANDPLEIRFSFAGETFDVQGLAVWVSDSEFSSRRLIGLRFETVDPKTREKLARLIHREQIRNLKMGVR
jgi:c-di-GMP-binding flagellar brake protein YcgR